ncbi:hypothetical protein GGI42DRAFT_83599 [Trichoderma sp. SZMC 28013]
MAENIFSRVARVLIYCGRSRYDYVGVDLFVCLFFLLLMTFFPMEAFKPLFPTPFDSGTQSSGRFHSAWSVIRPILGIWHCLFPSSSLGPYHLALDATCCHGNELLSSDSPDTLIPMQIQEEYPVKASETCKNLHGIQIETLNGQGHRAFPLTSARHAGCTPQHRNLMLRRPETGKNIHMFEAEIPIPAAEVIAAAPKKAATSPAFRSGCHRALQGTNHG